MQIERKDATITATGSDTDFPGTFEVILSTPDLDRDGDIFRAEEWQQPLPDKITFDIDHGMSVATTVGSGVPTINDSGQMVVKGTFSSLQKAQDVRTLVKEGHIDRTSVAYLTHWVEQKGGKKVASRELLNGAFVAIPANDSAKVLSAKGAKTGARNSAADAKQIQAIHDAASGLGADCAASSKAWRGKKAAAGSFEQNQQAVSDALSALYTGDDVWAYAVATFPDTVVFRVSGDADAGQWQASYVINDDGTATLGTPERVTMVEQITPVKSLVTAAFVSQYLGRKDADTEDQSDPVALIQATDAAIDQAIDLFAAVDITTLPAEIQQAIALVQAADTAIDELMDVAGIPDPDEDAEPAANDGTAAAAKAAAAVESKAAANAASEITEEMLMEKALSIKAAQFS